MGSAYYPRPTILCCRIGKHHGHFAIHILRRPDGWWTTTCDDHLRSLLRPRIEQPIGFAPTGQPKSEAPAVAPAGVSVTRPVGDLRSGQSTSIDRGA